MVCIPYFPFKKLLNFALFDELALCCLKICIFKCFENSLVSVIYKITSIKFKSKY